MKRRTLALMLALVMLFLCSCSTETVDAFGTAWFVVENGDGTYEVFEVNLLTVKNKNEGAEGVLEGVEGLHLVMEESGYGAYVTEIGSLKNGTNGGYIMIYTTVAKDCYEGGPTVTYEGTTLGQSGFGLSQMSVKDGTIILFRLEVYEF